MRARAIAPRATRHALHAPELRVCCRSFTALLCLLTIVTGLLVTLWIYYDAAPKWQAQYSTRYGNGVPASPAPRTSAPNSTPAVC